MTFKEWLFGLIDNPWVPKHWGFLHILTLVICILLIFGFYFLVKFIKNKEKTRNIIIITLGSLIAFFEFLGASGVEEQKNMLQTFGQVFKKAEERRLLDYEQKGKMFLKLSILFGVGIVILLL